MLLLLLLLPPLRLDAAVPACNTCVLQCYWFLSFLLLPLFSS
jgi:hypothetical protein